MAIDLKFDVIVVGAGPSGAFTAYNLAKNDYQVLLLEKESLPRYKSCGGAVSLKVKEIIGDIDLNNIIEDEVTKVVFTHNFQQPIDIDFYKPFTYMAMRDKFDNFLVKKAKKAGAKVIDSSQVVDLTRYDNQYRVKTEQEIFTTEYIVGADGVKSLIAKKLGLMNDLEYGVAYEKELKAGEERLVMQRGIIHLDYGMIADGYGWVFPKGNNLSVGVGTFKDGISLKKKLDVYIKEEGLSDSQVIRAKGHLLPIGGDKRQLNTELGLVVGDAAGLVDPLSGEGIFYALKSGLLASQVLDSVLSGRGSLDEYTELVNQQILTELKKAKLVSKIFFPFTKVAHKLFSKKEWILKQLIKIIYGEESYDDLYSSFKAELPFLRFKS